MSHILAVLTDTDLRGLNLVINSVQTVALAYLAARFYGTQKNGGVRVKATNLDEIETNRVHPE